MRVFDRLFQLSDKALLLLLAGASAAILSGAYISQYGFGLYPCELCLYQRYPYMAIIVLAVMGRFAVKSMRARWWIGLACVGLLLVDAGIAGYHTGVELKIFPGPSACSAKSTAGMTLEEMRASIMSAPLVSCDQAMGYIFGLSLAAWNALVALGLATFSVSVLRRIRKRAQL